MSHLFLPLPCRPESMGTVSSSSVCYRLHRVHFFYQCGEVKEAILGSGGIVLVARKGWTQSSSPVPLVTRLSDKISSV